MQQAPKKSSCGCGMKIHSHNAVKLGPVKLGPVKHGGEDHGVCPYKTNTRCNVAKLNDKGTNCTIDKKCVKNSVCSCPNINPNGTYKLLYGKCPNANYAKANPRGTNCPGYKPQ